MILLTLIKPVINLDTNNSQSSTFWLSNIPLAYLLCIMELSLICRHIKI